MKKTILALSSTLLLAFPLLINAAGPSLQNLLTNIPTFINKVLIPFLLGIAFLIFVINTIRFFVIESNNEKGREKAKALIIYSVAAFVFLLVFFGIVRMFVDSSGLQNQAQPCPDYIKKVDPAKCP